MKNSIKINAILAIVAFFVPAYPMEGLIGDMQVPTQKNDSLLPNYAVSLNELNQGENPLSNMHKITIYRQNGEHPLTPIPDNAPPLTDANFLVSLAIIQFLELSIPKSFFSPYQSTHPMNE